jgi:hypothetical protein
MTYIGLALSTPEIRVNASPTQYIIEETTSNKIREYVISRLEQLQEISKTLADNSPKCILIYCSDDTVHYYTYDEDFCRVFEMVKKSNFQSNQEDTYISPYILEKNEVATNNSYIFPSQSSVCVPTNTFSKPYISQEPSSHSTRTKEKEVPWGKLILGITIFIIIIGIIISALLDDNESDSVITNGPYSSFPDNTSSYLTPVSEPYSGAIISGNEVYDESEITIKASSGESCVVKLKNEYGVEQLSFYVRAGDVVTVGVPAEYMYVYFASGNTWYGEYWLFGEDTSYQKVNGIKDFTEYTWEYTLYPVSNGNLTLSQIDSDEF